MKANMLDCFRSLPIDPMASCLMYVDFPDGVFLLLKKLVARTGFCLIADVPLLLTISFLPYAGILV
jgi:hypothetical protein